MHTHINREKFEKAIQAIQFSHNHPRFQGWVKVKTPPRWMPKWISERLTQYKYADEIGQVIDVAIGNLSKVGLYTVHFPNKHPSVWIYTEKDLEFQPKILTPHEKTMIGI